MSNFPSLHQILTIEDIEYANRKGFIADPFVLTYDEVDYLFFEVFYRNPRKKMVGCARRISDKNWEYIGIALQRPELEFSYPYLLEHNSDQYMLPSVDIAGHGSRPPLKLYRAIDFPLEWTEVTEFEVVGVDPVVFCWNNSWYLIANTDGKTFIYYSNSLETGEWLEHPSSPLDDHPGLNRMGGSPVIIDEKLYLMYQDCEQHYGEKVRCCRVETLTRDNFRQVEIEESPLVTGQYTGGWNHLGMHTVILNPNRGYAIVDGHDNDGWSIGEITCDCSSGPRRLTPSPDEFNTIQSLARQRQLVKDFIGKATSYKKEHGTWLLIRRAAEKLIS